MWNFRPAVDDDVLRVVLFRAVSELEKTIKQGIMSGSSLGVSWVQTKIHDPEVWGVPDQSERGNFTARRAQPKSRIKKKPRREVGASI